MAFLISRASGNFTSSSTWREIWPNALFATPTTSTNTTTSYAYMPANTIPFGVAITGIVLFVKRLTTDGTFSIGLSQDNGVTLVREITVNTSDLPNNESWVFFKFDTDYTLVNVPATIGVKSSVANSVAVGRGGSANQWAFLFPTNTALTPAAGDRFLITGMLTSSGTRTSYTVTMNNTTTTDFGTDLPGSFPTQTNVGGSYNGIQIGYDGNLTWGTSESTNYYLRVSGHVVVWAGGTYNMGTASTPCPRSSTMTLQLDSTSDSSSSTYVFCAAAGSTVNIYGQSRTPDKNVFQCKLSADAAVNATSLTIDTDTGWLDNDEIVIAATGTDRTQCELGALNGAAGASTLTVDGFAGVAGGLAFAHSGTSPTQAEIINLTRNVVIRGNSISQPAAVRSLANATTYNIYWCRFSWTGSAGGTNLSAAAVSNIQYCAFFEYHNGSQTNTFRGATFSNNVSFAPTSSGTTLVLDGTVAPTVTNNTFMRGQGGVSIGSSLPNITFSGNTVVGANTSNAFLIALAGLTADVNISNLVAHSCGLTGIAYSGATPTNRKLTVSNSKFWRNGVNGISLSSSGQVVFDDVDVFGNVSSGISASNVPVLAKFTNCRISSDTTVTTPAGLVITTNSPQSIFVFENCKFSEVTGIYTANTVDINIASPATVFTRPMITLNNTLLGAATEVSNPANLDLTGFIKSSKHDQTEGAFKSWFGGGVVERDTTIFNTAAPSERLTPTSATIKLASGPRLVAVDDGGTITINAYVRKSATGDGAEYNGNQPRLIVRANPACGITTDTVLDTMTVGTGTWEQLTGTTAAVDADGALEFYVDCDGTAGWINVDDWSVS